ncbi:hypothetical protein [Sorangium sp. So ce233]|uniref:hypothetical protein n=1 Tax=Sorangium sp. So ce233 TaxID=3133290 RepID=UPI003F5F3172
MLVTPPPLVLVLVVTPPVPVVELLAPIPPLVLPLVAASLVLADDPPVPPLESPEMSLTHAASTTQDGTRAEVRRTRWSFMGSVTFMLRERFDSRTVRLGAEDRAPRSGQASDDSRSPRS